MLTFPLIHFFALRLLSHYGMRAGALRRVAAFSFTSRLLAAFAAIDLLHRAKHLLQNRAASADRVAPDFLFFFANDEVQAVK